VRRKKHVPNLPTILAGEYPAMNPSHVCGSRKPIAEQSEALLSDPGVGRGVLVGHTPSQLGCVFAVFDSR